MENPAPDIRLKQGDTLNRRLYADAKSGVLDWTGCSARSHLRSRTGALLLDMSSYLTLVNVSEDPLKPWIKPIELAVPFALTQGLPVGMHQTDIEITWSDATRSTSRTLYVEVEKDETLVAI